MCLSFVWLVNCFLNPNTYKQRMVLVSPLQFLVSFSTSSVNRKAWASWGGVYAKERGQERVKREPRASSVFPLTEQGCGQD